MYFFLSSSFLFAFLTEIQVTRSSVSIRLDSWNCVNTRFVDFLAGAALGWLVAYPTSPADGPTAWVSFNKYLLPRRPAHSTALASDELAAGALQIHPSAFLACQTRACVCLFGSVPAGVNNFDPIFFLFGCV